MSEKNRLQEYCQQNKILLPIYESWSIGEAHCLQWSAKVTIKINDKNIVMDTIVPCNTKTSAEKQAAMMMLDRIARKDNNSQSQLTKLRNATKLTVMSTHKHRGKSIGLNSESVISPSQNLNEISNIYMIDLENKPAVKLIPERNSLYIGFINSIHHSLSKYDSWKKCETDDLELELELELGLESYNQRLLYIIDGGINDLVDHFMTAMIYPIVNFIQANNISVTIHIISGDHASWCTRTCLEKILKWRNINQIEIVNATKIH